MWRKKTTWMLFISAIGALDAAYLTYLDFNKLSSGCGIGSCSAVLTSEYSQIYGIPTAAFGLLYYLFIFGLVLLYKLRKNKMILWFAKRFTLIGFLVSIVLVYIQTQIIGSICPFCMMSAATSTTLFILGYWDIFKKI